MNLVFLRPPLNVFGVLFQVLLSFFLSTLLVCLKIGLTKSSVIVVIMDTLKRCSVFFLAVCEKLGTLLAVRIEIGLKRLTCVVRALFGNGFRARVRLLNSGGRSGSF